MNWREEAMQPDERESKLPVWAQTKLLDLRRVAQRAFSDLETSLLKTNPDESDAILNPYGNVQLGTGPQGLGPRPDVRFPLRALDKGHAYIDARVTSDRRWLYVAGHARLYVVTDASNTLRIRSTHEEW